MKILIILLLTFSLSLAQDLPECVYDAFPNLNQTLALETLKVGKSKGLACDFCVQFFTDIGEILLDQDIEAAVIFFSLFGCFSMNFWDHFQIAHAVENLCMPIIWAFEPCYKLVEACLPDLIENFVNSLVPPREWCELLFICPEQ